MGAVAVITSGGGDVGRSIVCAGLGRALVERRRRVLLVDGDARLHSLDRILALDSQVTFGISDVIFSFCESTHAVYECDMSGLYLVPAPYRKGQLVSPRLMWQLVSTPSHYYGHILIDCSTGLGAGFGSTATVAQRVFTMTTPDPLRLHGSGRVRLLLIQAGISSQRLAVNRFHHRNFVKSDLFHGLDNMIDAVGIRLIEIVPEDPEATAAFAGGKSVSPYFSAIQMFHRLTVRPEEESVLLVRLEKL